MFCGSGQHDKCHEFQSGLWSDSLNLNRILRNQSAFCPILQAAEPLSDNGSWKTHIVLSEYQASFHESEWNQAENRRLRNDSVCTDWMQYTIFQQAYFAPIALIGPWWDIQAFLITKPHTLKGILNSQFRIFAWGRFEKSCSQPCKSWRKYIPNTM